jgi:hypothetical protein
MGRLTEDPVLIPCPDCDGLGWSEGEETSWVCCSELLRSGECCAAIYGIDRLVPVPEPIQVGCPRCRGYGEIEA